MRIAPIQLAESGAVAIARRRNKLNVFESLGRTRPYCHRPRFPDLHATVNRRFHTEALLQDKTQEGQ